MSAIDEVGGWANVLGSLVDHKELSRSSATAALEEILAGRATDAQISGLLIGLRAKGETVEELTGLAVAMRQAAEPLAAPEGAIDIVGTGGSPHRHRHALNISTMASIVAAAGGAVVCKHGNRKASSTSGSFDFLEALGVGIELSPTQLESCLASTGLGFAFARTYHPAMRHVGPVRSELGIPTVFNLLGPLANPGLVTRQVVGTATPEVGAKIARALANLGSTKAWVVVGHGGLDELTTTGPTTVFRVVRGQVDRIEIAPSDVGLVPPPSLDDLAGGTPEDNAAIFAALASGEETGPRRDVVALNAAAGLVVAEVVTDLQQGIELANATLDDGRARAKLDELIHATTGS